MEKLEKKEPTFERHDIEDTPFSIIKNVETGKCKLTCGLNLMHKDEFDNENEVLDYVNKKPWDLILNCICLVAENIISSQTQKSKEND